MTTKSPLNVFLLALYLVCLSKEIEKRNIEAHISATKISLQASWSKYLILLRLIGGLGGKNVFM